MLLSDTVAPQVMGNRGSSLQAPRTRSAPMVLEIVLEVVQEPSCGFPGTVKFASETSCVTSFAW